MEFLGRRDSQVKIHGHRIELSEIENVLIKYKDIKNAVADIKKSETGSVHLCVYYVSPENYSKEELSEYLGTFLTRYMIPFKRQSKQKSSPLPRFQDIISRNFRKRKLFRYGKQTCRYMVQYSWN